MKCAIKLLLVLLALGNVAVYAQAGKEKTPALVQSKNFTFYATMAVPQNSAELSSVMSKLPGGSSNVSLDPGMYQLTIKNDSLICYLPYYGRTYTASLDPNDRGIKFTSKDFSYKVTTTKKGAWNIAMKTNDVKENQQLMLSITTSGYATLNVTGVNRTYISFNGYVDESPKKRSL